MFGGMVANVASMLAAHKSREAWLDSMPKAEADKVRAEDAVLALAKDKHNQALEIANAGRARNFWGN